MLCYILCILICRNVCIYIIVYGMLHTFLWWNNFNTKNASAMLKFFRLRKWFSIFKTFALNRTDICRKGEIFPLGVSTKPYGLGSIWFSYILLGSHSLPQRLFFNWGVHVDVNVDVDGFFLLIFYNNMVNTLCLDVYISTWEKTWMVIFL